MLSHKKKRACSFPKQSSEGGSRVFTDKFKKLQEISEKEEICIKVPSKVKYKSTKFVEEIQV